MSNFRRNEAAVITFSKGGSFYIRECNNDKDVYNELRNMSDTRLWAINICRNFDCWQEMATYRNAISGMLNLPCKELTDDQIEWAMLKQLDDETAYGKKDIKKLFQDYGLEYRGKEPTIDTNMNGISERGKALIKELMD